MPTVAERGLVAEQMPSSRAGAAIRPGSDLPQAAARQNVKYTRSPPMGTTSLTDT